MVDVKKETESVNVVGSLRPTETTRPESFSLAHLSDLHLTSLVNVNISQLLNKRLLGYLSWRHKRRIVHRHDIIEALIADLRTTEPHHIAVTGDLTHIGLPMEYSEVEQWLPSLGTPAQVTVIPGNHEAYSGRSWFNSLVRWAPYLESDASHKQPGTAGFFPSLRIRGRVALIGLCTARPSLPFLATGSLGKEQLSCLEGLLQKTGAEGLVRVVLIHHPPVPGIVNWRKRLTDSKMFADVIKKHGAEFILHGHAHSPAFSELPGPGGNIPVIGAPSGSELSPWTSNYAKYNIYRINRSETGWELTMTVRGYSEDLGRFVFEEERTLVLSQPLNN